MIGPTKPDLWDEQMALEDRMIDEGCAAFFSARDKATSRGDGSSIGGANSIMKAVIAPVSAGIASFMAEATEAKRGRKHRAILAKDLDYDALAYLTVKSAIDMSLQHRRLTLQALAGRVGYHVEREAMLRNFEAEQPDVFKPTLHKLDKTTSHERHRRRVMVHAMNQAGVEWCGWSKIDRFHVGLKLFDILNETTGMFELVRTRSDSMGVVLTKEALDKIEKLDDKRSLTRPRMMACKIKPRPWTTDTSRFGGYWQDFMTPYGPLTMVKKRRAPVSSLVVNAVNVIQNTAWEINPGILEAMRWLVEPTTADLGVIPSMKELEIPPKPHDIETNDEARKQWRFLAARAHADNSSGRSRRYQVLATISLAEEYAQWGRVYYPYQLDFRGRMYAIPQYLNPQGTDYAKSLLRFADGEAVEDDVAVGWLAIHGANTFGVDKVGLDDRIKWVFDNEPAILACADDWKSNRWWIEADSPLSFLAFCLEWKGLSEQGYGFITKLPVAMDGSCNGIQHFSAMLLDPVGGAAVNLTPSDKPADIYQSVADKTLENLLYDSNQQHHPSLSMADNSGEVLARAALADTWGGSGLIDRKVTKRPVMVLPYGGTYTSCRDYVYDAIVEKRKDGEVIPFEDDKLFSACNQLSAVVWQSMGEVIIGARTVMAWLQKVAQVCGKAGLNQISWTTPSGFRVVQRYHETMAKRITTVLQGSTVKLIFTVGEDRTKVNKRRQGQAIAPNFVHSMDAAAMALTIDMAEHNGVYNYAMIHDSYGTTAVSTSKLAACIRHSFVQMYTDTDVIATFRKEILDQLPERYREDIPPVPAKGDLDLQLVMQSDFFFA